MLAYAAHRRPGRRLSPTALTLIVGGHGIALALLVTAKMDLTLPVKEKRTTLVDVPLPEALPEPEPRPTEEPSAEPQPAPDSFIDRPLPTVALPALGPAVEMGPPVSGMVPDIGPALDTPLRPSVPDVVPTPPAEPVRVAARPLTPSDLLRPPYPDSKRRSEEEAVLRLRLSIDERGRVVAVEPVGSADPAFLAAARSHLQRHWRYRPATEDGRPVTSSLTITLRFELEDE